MPSLGSVVGELFGTRVFDLDVGAEPEVLFVSDLHLRPSSQAGTGALDALLGGVADGGLVIVLGDLFDYWVGRSQLRAPGWQDVPALLARAADRRLRTYVCWGNRDFQLDSSFERETGARVVGGGLRLRHGGDRDLLCLHGDELCQNDRRYLRAKRWLRAAPLRWFLHHAPFALSRRLADHARRKSSSNLRTADAECLAPSAAAMRQVRRLGRLDLLFGHIHVAGRGVLPGATDELRFHVLPAFEPDTLGHARWRPGEELRLFWRGSEEPWPAAAPLGR